LLLAAGAWLFAACSFPGSVKPAVKVGLSAPFEGLYRDLGYEVLYGVRLAVRERNEAGGICGRYLVELVALNDFNEPEEAVWQARELAVDPGIVGVLGGWSSATARAVYPEYGRLHVPFSAPEPDPRLRPDEARRLGEEAARIVTEELGVDRAAVVSTGDEQDLALAGEFEMALARAGGQIVARATPAARDGLPALVKARPDVLFVAAPAPQAAEWIVHARQAGFEGKIVGGPGLGSQLLSKLAGPAAEGTLYVSPYPPVPDDPHFVAAYEALSGGAPPGPVGAWAYATTTDLLAQIEEAALTSEHDRTCIVQRRTELAGGTVSKQGEIYVYAVKGGQVFQQP
jgi:branched-chain amino acid transport system substrate-binding protein